MEGLRNLMESIDGPRVVAVETKMEDAVAAVRELQPSILVVDKGFGAPTVMDWLRLLSAAEKPTAVIVWGALMSESEALRFLQAGAAGDEVRALSGDRRHREDAIGERAGALVAIDPNTGYILAMASHPAFNPNIGSCNAYIA